MANSRQSVTIFSPSSKRPTNRTRSSITEHSFQGIVSSPRGGSVTYVSGTNCHPCVRPHKCTVLRDPLQNVPPTPLGQKGCLGDRSASPLEVLHRRSSKSTPSAETQPSRV